MRTLLALALLVSTAHASDVFKVAPPGLGTHVDLQTALDDAADGDIVLVDTSLTFAATDPPVQLTGKGLTIVGDGTVRAQMPVTAIEDVPLGSEVVLRNLAFQPGPVDPLLGGILEIRDSAGLVLVEDCAVEGEDKVGVDGGKGGPGMVVSNCDAVTIARCVITGGDGNSTSNRPLTIFAGHGGRALRVVLSKVTVHDTLLAGGDGGDDALFGNNGGGGALGIDSQNGEVWLVGTTVTGGEGGVGSPPGTSSFGGQIDGVVSHLRELDTTFTGGGSMPGLALVSGLHTIWSGTAVGLALSGPLRPGETATLTVDGPPGSFFGVFCDVDPGFLPVNDMHGVLVLATVDNLPFLGTIPASGNLVLTATASPVVGLDGFLKLAQVIMVQGPDGLVLSSPTTYVQVQNGL